jgi:RimJ/RimL family protein N-acetyltransferase
MDITGKLVRLRALRAEDAAPMAHLLADPRVVANLEHWAQPPYTVEQASAWLAAELPGTVRWAIESLEDGAYIGNTGLDSIDHHNRHCSWGIWIGPPERWGRGCGTEACILAVEYAFRHLAMEKVCLYVYAGNDRARRVYARAGFGSEGTCRRHFWRDGELIDVEMMAVFSDNPLYAGHVATVPPPG